MSTLKGAFDRLMSQIFLVIHSHYMTNVNLRINTSTHFSASKVLFNTIVIVNGPTPPGTGVIAPAISLTAS